MKYLSSPKKVAREIKTLKLKSRNSIVSLLLYIVTLVTLIYPAFMPAQALATTTEAFIRLDRHSTGAAISGTACMKSTSTSQTNVTIVFPSDWTISQTAANWTTSTSNLPVDPAGDTTTAWPSIGATASTVNGLSVTFSGGNFSASNTLYCFNFAGASSTIGAAGNDKTGQFKTEGGSPFTDSVNWATSIVSSNNDQITVTASVSASMTFSLSGNSVALGTISSGTTTSGTAITQTVATNARNGWVSWVESGTDGGSTNAALHSTTANSDIVSPGTFNGSPETLGTSGGYVLDVNTGTGSPAIATEYDGSTADEGGHLSYNLFRQTASNTAPAAGDTVTLVVKARSGATTPAANDYTDTLTVVAAGSF